MKRLIPKVRLSLTGAAALWAALAPMQAQEAKTRGEAKRAAGKPDILILWSDDVGHCESDRPAARPGTATDTGIGHSGFRCENSISSTTLSPQQEETGSIANAKKTNPN